MSDAPLPDDWEEHWERFAESAESNPAQRYRTRLIWSSVRLGDGPARFVDVGSGQGDICATIRRRAPGAEILGLELSDVGCEISRRKVPTGTFLQRDLVAPAKGVPERFRRWGTHAVCSEVLEHVDRPDLLLKNAREYLASGCRLVVTVPGGPMSKFDRHIGHRRHYTRGALRELLSAADLEVERVSAAGFPFHNLYRLAVLARGSRLVQDARGPSPSGAMRVVTAFFNVAFRANLPRTPWGWQIVAVARVPG